MRTLVCTLFLASLFCMNTAAQDKKKSDLPSGKSAPQEVTGKSLTDKSSYLLGYNFLSEFKNQGIDISVERMIAGLKDAAADKKPPMSPEEIQAVEQSFQRLIVKKQEEAFKAAAAKNQKEGDAYLKENALKDGVKQLESGLQYKIISAGGGKSPKTGEQIKFHYKGAFPDGTQFESSGETPIKFRVGGRIMPGMAEAIQRMKVGDKWAVYIPGNLAFGIQGQPPRIGPNQTLVYELELVEILK